MHLLIDIPMKPVTLNHVNKYSCRGNRVFPRKSNVAKLFEKVFQESLASERLDDIHNFALHYATLDNPCIVAEYRISLDSFFTKLGFVSKTCLDLENATKFATDSLFKEIKKTFKGCDDSQIVALFSDKWTGRDGISIQLQSMEIEEYRTKRGFLI